MSKCYKCDKEFTLTEKEIRCDNCKEIINFICHNCHEWFDIVTETGIKREECDYCGFFRCPTCGTCGDSCEINKHNKEIAKTIIEIYNGLDSGTITFEKIINSGGPMKITDYFGEVKMGKARRTCPRGVPISYAKGRIKSCIVKTSGFRTRDEADADKFKARVLEITDKEIGAKLTINNSRDDGTYGQEYRDAFNFAVCVGELTTKRITEEIKGKPVEYDIWERVNAEGRKCTKLDIEDLIVKNCEKCKNIYPNSENQCSKSECGYKKGPKKGQARELHKKTSNKDICQLNRGEFELKKDGGN